MARVNRWAVDGHVLSHLTRVYPAVLTSFTISYSRPLQQVTYVLYGKLPPTNEPARPFSQYVYFECAALC